MSPIRRAIPYVLRGVSVAMVTVALIDLADHESRATVPLLLAALVCAQLGGAFPTTRPDSARQLERLLDDGRAAVDKLRAHLDLFETYADDHPGKHEGRPELDAGPATRSTPPWTPGESPWGDDDEETTR